MAGWYKDKAIDNIDAKLALEGAGAGAKAFSSLARIPLDMDNREMAHQKLDNESTNIAAKMSISEANNRARIIAAEMGLEGKALNAEAKKIAAKLLAGSRVEVANIDKDKSFNRSKVDKEIEESRSTTAKENRKNKIVVQRVKNSPKAATQEEYFYDKNGNKVKKVNRAYVPPVDFTIDALDEVAKKAKRKKKS